MKQLLALAAALLVTGLPATAKTFVQDQAGMFSAATVDSLNTKLSNFNAQTNKEIVVQTVPSVAGGDVRTAAQNAFAQQQVNGVLIFISRDDRKDYVVPDRAAVQAGWWSTETSQSIARAMEAQFRAGDYDGGITSAVDLALNVYRSHLGSLNQPAPAYGRGGYAQPATTGGVHISMFWIVIMLLVAFFVVRSLMRAAAGPRYYGPGPGPGGPGPGYGPGYGGYGGYGGGGGFFSGLLGGLGGAWLGNELFGRQTWGGGGGVFGGVDPNAGGCPPADAGGWQSDPGQAGMGGGGGGDWGGGGFGGGDSGGFGGGDFGGGGGDAGGGW